jgi:hypothetical protein
VTPQRNPDAALPADTALPDVGGIHGCAPEALITDVQSTDPGYGNGCIRGAWTLEAVTGTTTPPVGQTDNTVLVSPVAIGMGSNPLAPSSTFAIHVSGSGQHNVPPNFGYAELFASLNHPSDDEIGTVDASMYTGIQFYGKLSFGDAGARLTVANLFTDPVGGMCTPGGTNHNDCYDNPGAAITTSTDWTLYQVPFASLEQLDYGFLSPIGDKFPKGAITHIRWDIGIPSPGEAAPWELWIDDLRFY